MRTSLDWWCSTCCSWHAPRFRTWPSTQVHLRCQCWHSWNPCFFLQAQSWKSTVSPLYKWLDLAFINQGWHSIHQGITRVEQVRREATGWLDINSVEWRTQRHLGRHCHQHSRCIIRGNYLIPRRRCRRSSSTAQRNQICWNSANSPFLPVSIRDNGPHQGRWTWVHQRAGSPNLSSHWWPTWDFILFQRISVAIQHFNGAILKNYFCHTDDNTASLPKHTCRV